MSLPKTLSHNTLARIQSAFDVQEITASNGGPFMTLTSPMSPAPVGSLRMFTGEKVHKMVYIGLVVPPIGLDSHMIFAFTRPESYLPHFTLDSVMAGPHFAFHLDLLPRVDLGANLAYMNAVFEPLTNTFDETKKIEGLIPAFLGPRQYALMSPWMLAFRASEEAFQTIQTPVDNYISHWIGLLQNGLPETAVPAGDGADFATRDRLNRAAIFDPDVDKVWHQVTRLVGEETSEKMRQIMINQEIEDAA